MLAVVYAVPRHEAWTVCANTDLAAEPDDRASIVMAPIRTAARPIPPAPRGRAFPPLGYGRAHPAGSGRWAGDRDRGQLCG